MIDSIEKVVLAAGKLVMDIYNKPFEVHYKKDKSPVTIADTACAHFLVQELSRLYPTIPAICEEHEVPPYAVRKHWQQCWLIDPLDGTKEFLQKNGEFTINIALIENQVPIFGIIYAPALDLFYFGQKGVGSFKKNGADWQKISPSKDYLNKQNIIIAQSRSHPSYQVNSFMKKLLREGKHLSIINKGSSIKLCLVADGTADVYPRFGDTMEWDIAAGHAILKYAGKNILAYPTNDELEYNKEYLKNPHFIVH